MSEVSPTALKRAASKLRRETALAARDAMIPPGPVAHRFRIATWNVNSLKARLSAIERFIGRAEPDVICLQETKATHPSAEATRFFDDHGYVLCHVGAGPYNGVAIASRRPITDVVVSGEFGDEDLDREPRIVSGVVDAGRPIRVVCVYVPHGRSVGHWHYEYKLAFLRALARKGREWLAGNAHLVMCGDMNVAPTNSDIFHPDAFVGLTHVTDAERNAWVELIDIGLVDIDAARWGPRERRFTWWNHGLNYSRNLGMRIDMIAADANLAATLDTTWIDHLERGGEKPSDHAALLADFALEALDGTD